MNQAENTISEHKSRPAKNYLLCDGKADPCSLCIFIDRFFEGLGLNGRVRIDEGRLNATIEDSNKLFSNPGVSIFKRAAAFTLVMILRRPILADLPESFQRLKGWSNEVLAFMISISALHGATINKSDGTTEVLKEPIKVSHHYFAELMDGFHRLRDINESAVPGAVLMISAIYESLCYNQNDVSYPKEVRPIDS